MTENLRTLTRGKTRPPRPDGESAKAVGARSAGTRPVGGKKPAAAAGKAPRKLPMRDFSRSLPMALLRSREAVMRQFRPSLRDHGLTEQQWRILRALTSIEQMEVSELARATYLLGPSLSRILRDLEGRQLIQRRSPESDLRRGIVSLTPAGVALIDVVAPISEAIYAEITRRYGARKLEALHEMLRELEGELLAIPVKNGADIDLDE
ncbi:homoprotocatechuate degradation operon regulator HpaR [Bradyrhizobium sp. U87765 SZCCT0131]|nr:homoprotocatechuate degradation operon regulator HpaR [Bradyrhizobium sp. U87765 SZCCT0131]MBR1260798.1 homoprotocatechuate degradation operon regulator HpaR [Bradyrhizobium sp. U87765 SZCCT0134]MBR1303754.1 homoprotocatechuate degradation operon regulator HpaR [Bradyrhizobium sp. U87765 SZCCT0110]MBR1319360.1 homoprotocatechuate degradation operon regulator HpaR [Bradyrhizobium sp. U87765 SZCCT0109]MBR1347685.1 homoprotocatechuate degradation operon regulator HpaR [Bradyrhizobium sp. U87765